MGDVDEMNFWRPRKKFFYGIVDVLNCKKDCSVKSNLNLINVIKEDNLDNECALQERVLTHICWKCDLDSIFHREG